MLFQVSMRRARHLHSLLRKYDINNTKYRKILSSPANRSCDNLQMVEYIFGTSKNSSFTFVDLSSIANTIVPKTEGSMSSLSGSLANNIWDNICV